MMFRDERPCVLIVDDDRGLATVIQLMLDHAGYRTVAHYSAAGALAWLRRHHAALIVLDLLMPGMDGLALLRRLRQATATHAVPVIVLTARPDTASRGECEAAGATAYLTKPVTRETLIEHVRLAISQPAVH